MIDRSLSQSKIDRRAFSDFPFGPYLAAMATDYPLHDSQSYSGTLEFLIQMQPLEGPEYLFFILWIESGAVVSYKINKFGAGSLEF